MSTRTLSRQTKARIIAIPLALVIAGVWYFTSRGNTTGPDDKKSTTAGIDVGDCLQNKGSESDPDLTVVDCGGATADYKVVESYPSNHSCEPGLSQYQMTRNGRAQYTLCMEKLGQ